MFLRFSALTMDSESPRHSRMLQVWYIYRHLPPKKGPDVGKYTSTMEDVRLVESMQIPIFDDFHIRLSQAKITKAGKPDFASS